MLYNIVHSNNFYINIYKYYTTYFDYKNLILNKILYFIILYMTINIKLYTILHINYSPFIFLYYSNLIIKISMIMLIILEY